jgi:GNAT superfamily N-acetyltransferase
MILAASQKDVRLVAYLHKEIFIDFFLSSLGETFLEEMYASFLSHPSGIFFVAKKDGKTIGFVVGTSSPEFFFSDLRRRRWLPFALKVIPAIIKNPRRVILKIAEAIRYRGEISSEMIPGGTLLSSIGTSLSSRGDGTASHLLKKFETAALANGSTYVYLITDADKNNRANAFYTANGYVAVCRFQKSPKRAMIRYEKYLQKD